MNGWKTSRKQRILKVCYVFCDTLIPPLLHHFMCFFSFSSISSDLHGNIEHDTRDCAHGVACFITKRHIHKSHHHIIPHKKVYTTHKKIEELIAAATAQSKKNAFQNIAHIILFATHSTYNISKLYYVSQTFVDVAISFILYEILCVRARARVFCDQARQTNIWARCELYVCRVHVCAHSFFIWFILFFCKQRRKATKKNYQPTEVGCRRRESANVRGPFMFSVMPFLVRDFFLSRSLLLQHIHYMLKLKWNEKTKYNINTHEEKTEKARIDGKKQWVNEYSVLLLI